MELLKELYSISSPSRKEKRMRKFICDRLKQQGIKFKVDKTGNVYAVKGSSETYPCVVAHLDEVHLSHTKGFTVMPTDDVIFGFDIRTNKYCGIGADDKNGIWICLKCLEEFDVLKCAFFVGEEVGCYGSSRADMSFFENCRYVLQCDRKGNSDLIRWAGATELCSDEFIAAIDFSSYGYKVTNGMMTDVLALKQHELAVSCVNISCGYYNPHSDTELTRWSYLNKCLEFVRNIIRNCTEVYLHTHTPVVRYFGGWEMDDWYPSMRVNVRSSREQQLSSLKSRMSNILFDEPHLSLDEVSDRIGSTYNRVTFADFQDIYIEIANRRRIF
ncbi:hypothetical protein [Bacteroides reticulotermitis]|uniref:hypothetical protein n=1 Tax=Bacteroides reticulotermitis TaxID=1133319 RepID=UPI003A882B81